VILLEKEAFIVIQKIIEDELFKQGFNPAEEMKVENGQAVMYSTEDVAYSLVYNNGDKNFILCSTTLTENGKPGNWRELSKWLFDPETGTREDATSIGNDFLEIIEGPKRAEAVKIAKRKRKKTGDDENNTDPMFFFNRLVNIFPEFKDELNNEKITYGQVRFATMAKNVIAPKCQKLALERPESDEFAKLKALLAEMYKNGDSDLDAVITAGIINNITDETAAERISEDFDTNMKKIYKCSRKLIGKKIKPEKKKKKNKIIADALNNANRTR
jgi:hypothetical protein